MIQPKTKKIYGLPGNRPGERKGTEIYDDIVRHGLSDNELAAKYDASPVSVRRWRLICERQGLVETAIPDSETPDYNQFITLKQERVLVLSDVEVPDHDADLLRYAMEVGQEYAIECLVINGDFFSFDMFTPFRKRRPQRTTFEEDLDLGVEILKGLSNQFSRIIYIPGNHEMRPIYMLDGQLPLSRFFGNEGLQNITWSDYQYCFLESGGRRCLICHQKNYSGVPLSVPRRVIQQCLCDVLCGHDHKLNWGMDHSAQYWFGEGGTCRDPIKTMYRMHTVTCHPHWDPGFYMILEGWGVPLHKEMLAAGFHTDRFRQRRWGRFKAGSRK